MTTLTARERLHRLVAAHPELELGPAPGSAILDLDGARVVLSARPADDATAPIRGRQASLAYRIEGALADHDRAPLRERLQRVATTWLSFDPPGDTRAATAAPGDDAVLEPSALADPSLLSSRVDAAYRTSLGAAWATPTFANLPPCWSLAMRPLAPPSLLASPSVPLPAVPAPCDSCAARAGCPASFVPRVATAAPLAPLRHDDLDAAARAALEAFAAAFERRLPDRVLQFLSELATLRGQSDARRVPFELSVKCTNDRLEPLVRMVEYGGAARGARADALAQLVARIGGPGDEATRWLAEVRAAQGDDIELSIGLEAALDGTMTRAQLYAHVHPEPRERARDLIARLLTFAATPTDAGAEVAAVHAFAPGTHASELVLAAYAPTAASPRRVKLYFARPLARGHGAARLVAADAGPLTSHVAATGLAVAGLDGSGARWEKWDAPAAHHPQVSLARGLVADFARGLHPRDASRLERLLDGRAFLPWITWTSAGPASRTLYFVPR